MSEPAKPAASVIRMVHGTEESASDRMLKKHVPAWVGSGAFHVLVLTAIILAGRLGKVEGKSSEEQLQAVVDNSMDPEKQKNLTNVDEGLDSEVKSMVPDAKEADVTVDTTKVIPESPPGINAENTNPLNVPLQAGMGEGKNPGVTGDLGGFAAGTGGDMGAFFSPGFNGRNAATRGDMVRRGGGNDKSEAAVARGLAWLAKQQRGDGSWVYDGSSAPDTCAATAMALLPFLAAGQTHKEAKGNDYQKTVLKGVTYLISLQNPGSGNFRTASNMYSHSIAAVALCELYGMTGDKTKVLYPAQAAIDYIVKAQGANGSWGYRSGQEGDTSIVGWQIQALKSAEMCRDIRFPRNVYDKARKFLDDVSGGSKKSTYGYREGPGQPGSALTAVGLLCRYYMDGWGPVHEGMRDGVEGLLKRGPSKERFNMYYYYYATQVVHFHEGDAWHKDWNPKMRDMLIEMQVGQEDAKNGGSWSRDMGMIGGSCGRLGTTCLALLTLEVYYRHLPLYKRGTDGRVEIERVK